MNPDTSKAEWKLWQNEPRQRGEAFSDDGLLRSDGRYDRFNGQAQELLQPRRHNLQQGTVEQYPNGSHSVQKPASDGEEGKSRATLRKPTESLGAVSRTFIRKTFQMCAYVVMVLFVSGAPAFALFETNKQLIAYAEYSLVEAVRSAITFVPGRAVEAGLGKREGRTVWKIEIIDAKNHHQTVYIDAQTGDAYRER